MKKILVISILVLNSFLSFAVPQIYPSILEINLNKDLIYDEITISNTDETLKKYKIEVVKENNEYDLSPYIEFFPKVMEIEPDRQKRIRIAIKNYPYKNAEDGEVRALLKISEIESDIKKKYKKRDKENKEFTTNIDILFNVAMMIYGRKGEIIEKVSLKKNIKNNEINLSIRNEGNISFIPKIMIISNSKKEEVVIPKLLRGGERNVKLDLNKYRKDMKVIAYDSKGKKILEK